MCLGKGRNHFEKAALPAYDKIAVRLLCLLNSFTWQCTRRLNPFKFRYFYTGTRNSDTKAVVESVKPEMFTDILRALLDSADGTNETDKAILRQVQQAIDEMCPFTDKDNALTSETTNEKHEKAKQAVDQAAAHKR